MKGSISTIPELADVPYPVQMEPTLIEYYHVNRITFFIKAA